eukprot:CAMPEP_0119354208 /NCGR_PEP_ID=MMETSP1334-20130426/3227_1 /TAXON_ID=127549 /ORGANISM="Calcidiscus leptoporus, Strain RCC1130" /LENGTH=589 /DNA_ID=CAMNT_0007367695 /DNA_START=934 /DNA_END=2703 /DNA_ORIENTATION=-
MFEIFSHRPSTVCPILATALCSFASSSSLHTFGVVGVAGAPFAAGVAAGAGAGVFLAEEAVAGGVGFLATGVLFGSTLAFLTSGCAAATPVRFAPALGGGSSSSLSSSSSSSSSSRSSSSPSSSNSSNSSSSSPSSPLISSSSPSSSSSPGGDAAVTAQRPRAATERRPFPGGEEVAHASLGGPGREMMSSLLKLTQRAQRLAWWRPPGPSDDQHAFEAEAVGGEVEWREGALDADSRQWRTAFGALHSIGEVVEFVASNVAERAAKSDRAEVLFSIGQVLRHKKFGFRAAVFGWERRPQIDVSGWDGVAGLPSGAAQPFYKCVPDMADCISLLGGPRGVKYVAQENLEPLQEASQRAISHELLPQVFDGYDDETGRFVPVQQLRYWYPQDTDPATVEDDVPLARAVHTIERLQVLLNAHAHEARQAGLLRPLRALLRTARCYEDAFAVERVIVALMVAHSNDMLMQLMQQSGAAAQRNELDVAVRALEQALEMDPLHAETWGMLSVLHVRQGAFQRALERADECLQLEPQHFGAMAARGSALRGLRRYDEALSSFESSLELHPWCPGVATSLYKTQRALALRGQARPA